MTITMTEDIAKLLVILPIVILLLYSLVIIIGNHWILRAGGQTAHENYPKVTSQMKMVFVLVSVSFLLFFLVIFGYVPSEVLVTLVSVAAGVLGTLMLKEKR